MEHKSNKELAIEATIGFTKSWNASDKTKPITSNDFIETLKDIYSAICSLDE